MRRLLLLLLFLPYYSFGSEREVRFPDSTEWRAFSKQVRIQKRKDYRDGLSYIISGSLAVVGGIWGESVTDDAVERGVFTVFQSIGIASVGYGAYLWKIGGEERSLHETLLRTRSLSEKEKTDFLLSYNKLNKHKRNRIRFIKAITHGLVAGLNLYNASRQDQDSVKNALFFIGGVNLLAAASFTFEF